MADELACWKCGESAASLPLPLGLREACPSCGADLHVCRMCRFYDPSVSRACREPVAEPVTDKERANFCGYFEAAPGAYRPGDQAAAREARERLDTLFGGESAGSPSGTPTTADEARQRLERLFGKDDGD